MQPHLGHSLARYIISSSPTHHPCHHSSLPPITPAVIHPSHPSPAVIHPSHPSPLPSFIPPTHHPCCHSSLPPITPAIIHPSHPSPLPSFIPPTHHPCHHSSLPPITPAVILPSLQPVHTPRGSCPYVYTCMYECVREHMQTQRRYSYGRNGLYVRLPYVHNDTWVRAKYEYDCIWRFYHVP